MANDFPPSTDSAEAVASQLALHGLLSRLIASLINERLALGLYDPSKAQGALVPLNYSPNCDGDEGIHFPMTEAPPHLEDFGGNGLQQIIFLDPEDIPFTAQQPQYQHITLSAPQAIVNGPQLMQIIRSWNDPALNNPGFDALLPELDDCLMNAVEAFKNPPKKPSLASGYLEWEQALLDGHPTHPMFLSRIPFSQPIGPVPFSQLSDLTLHFLQTPASNLIISGDFNSQIKPLLDAVGIIVPEGYVVLAVHEYQLKYLKSTTTLQDFDIEVISQTCPAKAQASLRTVTPWNTVTNSALIPGMAIKLPIAIRKTSALRTISAWSTTLTDELNLHFPRMKSLEEAKGILHVCRETAAVSLKCDDFDIAKHVSCIVREDATSHAFSSFPEGIALPAALTQRNRPGEDTAVVRAWGLDSREKRIAFLEEYTELLFRCFVPPLLEGFGFDAHGQNSLLHYEVSTGKLLGFSIRGLAGVRIHQDTFEAATGHRVNLIQGNCNDAPDMQEVHSKSFHALIQTHLYRIIRALDLHSAKEGYAGWKVTRKVLERHLPEGGLRKDWLETKVAQYKCFLRMRFEDRYRDYVYMDIPNLLELGREE